MVELPTRHYVQRSPSDSTYGPARGWETVIVTFDLDEAEAYAVSFQHAAIFEEGDNVSEFVSTIARVVTSQELADEGVEAIVAAENETRVQLWTKLAEWAEPLIDPRQK